MTRENEAISALRRELRAAMGDRSRLSKLHSVITDQINRSYGEERELLLKLRQDVKDALNCRTLNAW